ncbi:MarR family transcriptional regulator [Lactobacillus sp. S2-2]|uniref:MarR family winged helix-turn-helix transcriptional regulator n=1 Tax=Lactobacillus sp. S2-2 TaxID=2692917 RepID=UPI001F469ED3|nr:MarR family winged helix-turn-helix transcriptional regulator [Lactobacillus sp. S2-2]MCF6515304.1 MarR family transcriptional regulator [Lactobacillus sp. S2-2]
MINDIRNFNRKYTQLLGLLNKKVFNTDFSLTEGRILLEIKANYQCSPQMISQNLNLDKSYTSRIIKSFEKRDLLIKTSNPKDLRVKKILLTELGNQLTDDIDQKSIQQIQRLLETLSDQELKDFYKSVMTLEKILFEKGDQNVEN